MSLFLEDSPVYELKMDISDTASNSESPLNTSPDALTGKAQPSSSTSQFGRSPNYMESDPDDGLRILKSDLNSNQTTKVTTISSAHLDNRRPKIHSAQLISVNNHPLMSPQAQNDNRFVGEDFADKLSSPLRLASPLSGATITTCKSVTSSSSPKRRGRLDLLDKDVSSDSEADISQYQANVEPSYQSVSLVSRQKAGVSSPLRSKDGKSNSCSNINVHSAENSMPRQQSVESVSIRSFDELDDMEQHREFMSRSSSASPIEATATTKDQEAYVERPSRNMQTIVLYDGSVREIDMKVIEPYKRVLSHGGYLTEDCQNAIVIFSSCFLPDKSRADYHYVMDSLFLYVLKTLEQLVTEEEDYVLLYLHGGAPKSNIPSFPWLKRCYQMLDRKLRKSLKNVYMVHPTFWLKSLVFMSRPFISSKFWRKLIYVKSLEELYSLVPNVERQAVPEKVKTYEAHLKKSN